MTYPQPSVGEYIAAHFVAVRANLGSRNDWPLFRSNHIIWTPTGGFMDRNGSMHYYSAGFLPPDEYLAVLRIGRARCLMAWTRNAEAAAELEQAAAMENSYAAEALYWLGVSRYLERRDSRRMWDPWRTLAELYPDSPWARKIYRED